MDIIKHTLYGDGIHDDYLAIQELLNSGASEIALPVPQTCYCISKTLKIHSNQTLRLPETATIRLLPNSSCLMLTNAEYDAHDISIIGGIWDYDNIHQAPNPIITKRDEVKKISHFNGDPNHIATHELFGHFGCLMSFSHVTRFSIRNLTLKNPVTFCIRMAYMTYFTVENIKFDQNLGNPRADNMDGIHIDGGCHFGSIRNVQGTCYDDIVALNADDNYDGPISDIQVDGVFGKNSLRGVRLLSIKSLVSRISISNIFGTFYQNCIGLTYFFPPNGVRGKMSHISIRNIYGNNAPRIPEYGKGDNSHFPFSFIWVDGELDIDFLTIDNLCRNESLSDAETLKICKGANIKTLSLSNILHQNSTGKPLTMFLNKGNIGKLYMYNVDPSEDTLLVNEGTIGKVIEA